MGKLDQMRPRDRIPSDEIADPRGLEVACQYRIKRPIADRVLHVDHLRPVVVAGVPSVGMGVQPGPTASGEPFPAAGGPDLDRNAESGCGGQQLP